MVQFNSLPIKITVVDILSRGMLMSLILFLYDNIGHLLETLQNVKKNRRIEYRIVIMIDKKIKIVRNMLKLLNKINSRIRSLE